MFSLMTAIMAAAAPHSPSPEILQNPAPRDGEIGTEEISAKHRKNLTTF
jgi:hypothetical protein